MKSLHWTSLPCLSTLKKYYEQCGRPDDFEELVGQLRAYICSSKKNPRELVSRCADLLQYAPRHFQSLNSLLLFAGDGDSELFSSTNEAGDRIEIAMVIAQGKGYLCCLSKEAKVDEPPFMDSDELSEFISSRSLFSFAELIKTISRRWAPFVMELLQLTDLNQPSPSRSLTTSGIHPILSTTTRFWWDITHSPLIDGKHIEDSAVDPPSKYMVITLSAMGWEIPIHPRAITSEYVDVWDVLDGIYRFFLAPVDQSDAEQLMKRIDMLKDTTLFRGLSSTDPSRGYWELELDDLAHPTRPRPSLRLPTIVYVQHLSWKYRLLPFTFYLPGVVLSGDRPVTGGGFSDVWKGRLGKNRVCVKVLRFFLHSTVRDDVMKDLISEVLLLRHLRHPNIVPFLGVNEEVLAPSLAIITPWMTHGNLAVYLQRVPCSLKKKVRLIQQIVDGVRYLHARSPSVIHCDLKAGNILVSEEETCCIADFGLSVLEKAHGVQLADNLNDVSGGSTTRGSLRWLAPECIRPAPGAKSQTSRDVYALGCTMFEVLTGRPPFFDERSEVKVMIDILNGVRPTLPPGLRLPASIWRLVKTCWREDATSRPTADGVAEGLEEWVRVEEWASKQTPVEDEEEDMEYDLSMFANDISTGAVLQGPALQDSVFDARKIWDPQEGANLSEDDEGEVLPHTAEPTYATDSSDTETDTDSSGWWSDESSSLPSTPTSQYGSILSSPIVVSEELDVNTLRLQHPFLKSLSAVTTHPQPQSEPISPITFNVKPPKRNIWNSTELQRAWRWYMDRQCSSS